MLHIKQNNLRYNTRICVRELVTSGIRVYTHAHTCICIYMCIGIHEYCIHEIICVRVCVYVCAWVCVCMYTIQISTFHIRLHEIHTVLLAAKQGDEGLNGSLGSNVIILKSAYILSHQKISAIAIHTNTHTHTHARTHARTRRITTFEWVHTFCIPKKRPSKKNPAFPVYIYHTHSHT